MFYVVGSNKKVNDKKELIEWMQKYHGINIHALDNQDRNALYWACCDNCNSQ